MQAALAQALDIEISGILKRHGCDREASNRSDISKY